MTSDKALQWILLIAVFMPPCYTAELAMPACNPTNQGRLWPEQANSDRAAAKRAAQCGELQMCTHGKWRYGWRPIAVNVNQLGKNRNAKIAGCEETKAATPAKPGA